MQAWTNSKEIFMPTMTWVELQSYYFPKPTKISPIKLGRAYLLIADYYED